MRICTVNGCNKKHLAKGFCNKHYARYKAHGNSHTVLYRGGMVTHGMTNTPIYKTWKRMKDRCSNPNNKNYKYYGGRGIKVCDRWVNSFENFYEDMGDKPKGLVIDRINNDGNYEPNNCRWVTITENNRNKSDIVLSVELAKKIRRLKEQGFKCKNIAETLNITPKRVEGVLYSNNWK